MSNVLKYIKLLFICSLAIGLSSCDTDEDDIIYDYLVGDMWVGNLGFADAYDYPLESGLYFEGNGLGYDDQVYFDDPTGEVAFTLKFRWDIYNGVLKLDYGPGYPLFEIYDVDITRNRLSGALYVDGVYDGTIVLERF